VGATETTLARLNSFVNQGGAAERLRFTSALSNGKDLYAFRYAVNDRANTLYYRESEQAIVVVSEPLDSDRRNWIAVPESHALIAKAGEKARVVPFLCERREAAE
jgi:predicted glutamine amidotransferase